jgi:hypothetical protein
MTRHQGHCLRLANDIHDRHKRDDRQQRCPQSSNHDFSSGSVSGIGTDIFNKDSRQYTPPACIEGFFILGYFFRSVRLRRVGAKAGFRMRSRIPGCGLCRSEVAALTIGQGQKAWCLPA